MDQLLAAPGGRRACTIGTLAFLLLLAPIAMPLGLAQQSASLQEGTQLQPIATLDAEVGNALGNLLGTRPDGKIGRVTVARERAASLQLRVEYEGFEENWLNGHALRAGADGDPEQISEIKVEPIELDGSGEATIEFELDENVEEGASFESSHLVLFGAKRAYSRTGAAQTFVLQKQWDKAQRAENIEIRVFARALQDLVANYKAPPEPGSRPDAGSSSDEVAVEYVRLRIGRPGQYRYLSADNGGGGRVRLQSSAADTETFQIGWIDEEADIGRLRTANGWHLLALHPDGRVDAASADPADPATVLHFKYNGDGTYIIEAADDATTRRVTGAAEASRLRILARPAAADLIKRTSVGAPTRAMNIRPNLNAEAARGAAASGADPLTLYHDGNVVRARRSGEKRGAAFYRERNVPIPRDVGRPGDGEGPASAPVFDLEGVPDMLGYISGQTVAEGPDIEALLGINSQIWPDLNPASGIYYFVPSGYYLKWDPDKQYDLSLTDEMAGDDGAPYVLVRARLKPRFTRVQRRAAEILVRQAARAAGKPFFDLRQMPMSGEGTTSTAAEALSGHHQVDNVVVHPPSDVLGEVEVSWRMPTVTRESFVELLRRDQAVSPQLLIRTDSGEGATHRVPLHFGWEEPESYPPLLWQNGSFQRNGIPHPMKLKGLHAMVLNQDERVQVVSWDLSKTALIPSQARAAMGQELTTRVRDNAFLTWVDYAVLPDDASTETAVRTITGGVSEQVRQPLTISLFDPLAASGARQLTVFVKSRYLEAGGDQPILRQFEFSADGEVREVPFYLGRADVDVPFEWTVRLRMPDGQNHERPIFLQGDAGLQLVVSSSSLREIFGELPGEVDQ